MYNSFQWRRTKNQYHSAVAQFSIETGDRVKSTRCNTDKQWHGAKNPQRWYYIRENITVCITHSLHTVLLHKLKMDCFFIPYLPKLCYCLFCYIFQEKIKRIENKTMSQRRQHKTKAFNSLFSFFFRSLLSFIVCWHSFLPKYLLFLHAFFSTFFKPCVQVARSVNRSSKQSFYYDFSGYCYFGFYSVFYFGVRVNVLSFCFVFTSFRPIVPWTVFIFIFFFFSTWTRA